MDLWDVVEVTFYGPSGEAAKWIGDDKLARQWSTNYLLSDEDGNVRWVRYGAQDEAGDWSVRITIDDSLRVVNYDYTKFSLPRLVSLNLGVPLFGCSSDEAVIYFSDAVNFAITVDMHAELRRAADLIEERLGIRTSNTPAIHLLANVGELGTVRRAVGANATRGNDFYRSGQNNSGIYLQTDRQLDNTYDSLTHLYVYYLLDEVVGGNELPRWLQAGIGRYYEFEVRHLREPSTSAKFWSLISGDRSQQAAAEGELLPVRQLENRAFWNSLRGIQSLLSWDQSYMLVRYIAESYGDDALLDMVRRIAQGASTGDAVLAATGVDYLNIERDFAGWMAEWDDPDRAVVRGYLRTLSELADEEREIRTLRNEATKEWNLNFNRVKFENSAILLRDRSKALLERADELRPPEAMADLHEKAMGYFRIFNAWMTKQAEFVSTNSESKRLAANALIPEYNYRSRDFRSSLSNTKYILNISD